MRTYEVLFILSPQLPEEDVTNLITEFRGVAEKSGAKLSSEEAWGRRRLAYPIGKITDGIYHLFIFETEGDVLNELDRRMKNSDKILRHMIVRVDEAQKRAAKLAKRNPKKERRPVSPAAPAQAPAAVVEAASAPAEIPPTAAPEATPAPEAAE
ncbi:MAG: 30S ribosomal protein S6 [Thermoanaerobaculia bacterium]